MLLENTRRGAPPSEEEQAAAERDVPRVPGLPLGTPLVPVANKIIEQAYVQVCSYSDRWSGAVFVPRPRKASSFGKRMCTTRGITARCGVRSFEGCGIDLLQGDLGQSGQAPGQ